MSSPEDQLASMIANLPEKTGRSLDEWMALLEPHRGSKHGELMKIVKGEHGVSHGYANVIVHTFRQGGVVPSASGTSGGSAAKGAGKAKAGGGGTSTGSGAGADPVAAQYEGKEALIPIRDAIMEIVAGLGDEVEVSPKKSYVSLRRKVQFATVHPSTKSRLDLGLKLKGREPGGRLEDSGSWNAMVTHRVRLADASEVDKEVRGWLKDAYDAAD